VFDQRDIVTALATGNYLQGSYAAESGSLVKPSEAGSLVKPSEPESDVLDQLFADVDV
jgi:hypothetical protein